MYGAVRMRIRSHTFTSPKSASYGFLNSTALHCTAHDCCSRSFEFSPSRNASHADARDALCLPAQLHEAPFLLRVFVCYVDVYSRRSRCRSNVLYRS